MQLMIANMTSEAEEKASVGFCQHVGSVFFVCSFSVNIMIDLRSFFFWLVLSDEQMSHG